VASDTRAAGDGTTADVEAPAFVASVASCRPGVGWLVVGRVVELVEGCDVVVVDCGVVEFGCDAAVVGVDAGVTDADAPVEGAGVPVTGADVTWPFGAVVGSALAAAGLVCTWPSGVGAVSVVVEGVTG
jgi:hypothetical protein